MAHTPQAPNLDAQRTAMKKLAFLVGEWSGHDQGEWTETAEITIGARPPQQLMELVVRRTDR